jgi:DNA-binding MarR family transcriptional regulator
MSDAAPAGELARALRDTERATVRANAALARRLGLTGTDLAALQHLAARPAELGPVELGSLLGIRSASATVLVDRMEQAGHVRRIPHRTDGRRRVVELTEQSRRAVLAELATLTAAVDRASAKLTEDEAAAATRFLRDCASALHAYADADPTARADPASDADPMDGA